jgi:hypothetical protein
MNEHDIRAQPIALAVALMLHHSGLASTDARGDEICDSLSRVACTPERSSDPTGVANSKKEVKDAWIDAVRQSFGETRSAFSKVLADPENEYFRTMVKSTFGAKIPGCQTTPPEPSCDKVLADTLGRLTIKDLVPNPVDSIVEPESLESLQFVTDNPVFKAERKNAAANLKKRMTNPAADAKAEAVFKGVRQSIADAIAKWPIADESKAKMLMKVRAIRYEGSDCSQPTDKSLGVSALLVANAFYTPASNTLQYCSGFMMESDSAFQMAFTIGHEISHSLDPCMIAKGTPGTKISNTHPDDDEKAEAENPFGVVLKCLRGARSIGAIRDVQRAGMNQWMHSWFGRAFDVAEYLNPGPKINSGLCAPDQIVESFADWLGTEGAARYLEANTKFSTAEYRAGYANAYRKICQITVGGQYDDPFAHPASARRIDAIIAVHPTIRRQMGCPEKNSSYDYCSMTAGAGPTKESAETGVTTSH